MIAPSIKVTGIGSLGGSLGGEVENRAMSEEVRSKGPGNVGFGGSGQRSPEIRFTFFGEMALRST